MCQIITAESERIMYRSDVDYGHSQTLLRSITFCIAIMNLILLRGVPLFNVNKEPVNEAFNIFYIYNPHPLFLCSRRLQAAEVLQSNRAAAAAGQCF